MTDEKHDPDDAMERFEDLGRRMFQVTPEQLEQAEEADADAGDCEPEPATDDED